MSKQFDWYLVGQVPDEKTSTIQWTERRTGALMDVLLWPWPAPQGFTGHYRKSLHVQD
jgi:hypothetical protein